MYRVECEQDSSVVIPREEDSCNEAIDREDFCLSTDHNKYSFSSEVQGLGPLSISLMSKLPTEVKVKKEEHDNTL